jgi:hypothetical protein
MLRPVMPDVGDAVGCPLLLGVSGFTGKALGGLSRCPAESVSLTVHQTTDRPASPDTPTVRGDISDAIDESWI